MAMNCPHCGGGIDLVATGAAAPARPTARPVAQGQRGCEICGGPVNGAFPICRLCDLYPNRTPGICAVCGQPCKDNYATCFQCFQEGGD